MTRYLGFMIGFQVSLENRFKSTLKQKLTYWCTTKLSLASRILIANQVLLASIWYIASYWYPHIWSILKVQALICNYIWLEENGKTPYRAKVAWEFAISSKKNLGGLKLLDPELQMQALLTQLLVSGLLLGIASW